MKQFRFRKFQVYKDSLTFRCQVVIYIKKFPKSELFILSSQTLRALNSILLNIAEGSGRNTDKDFAHFLNLAYSSLNEVVSCLDIALVEKYINQQIYNELTLEADNLGKQLTAFRKKVLNSH